MAKKPTKSPSVAAEMGQIGQKRTGGFIREEFLTELQGRQGVETYKEMSENDPTIGAILFAIQMLIRQVKWSVDAFSTDPEDMKRAVFLETCMTDMSKSWESTLVEMLSMLAYGFSFHEIVYKVRSGPGNGDGRFNSRYDDGLIGWKKLPIRAQDSLYRWEYASEHSDHLIGFSQMPAPSYRTVTIPLEKGLLFRPGSHKDNPEGRSILRNSYVPWYYKKNIERIEAIGIERDLAGIPIIWVPPQMFASDATPEEKQALAAYKEIVTNLKRDEQEGMVFPNAYDANGQRMYDISLLSTGGNRQVNTDIIVDRYDRRMAMSVLADFLFIGHKNTGSFALIDNKTDIFVTAIAAWLESVSEVFNRFAIPRLWRMNGWSLDRCPKLVYGDIETPDLEKLGSYVSNLAGSGVNLFPNQKLENWLKRAAGMPVDTSIEEEGDESIDRPSDSNEGQTSTSGEPTHIHHYIVDDSGNGLTNSTSSGPDHVHKILSGEVEVSGKIPHSHTLT